MIRRSRWPLLLRRAILTVRCHTVGPAAPAATSALLPDPAPFFVALVPNPASEIARGGFLTTSLYYRLDPDRMPLYFDGDRIAAFNRLSVGGDTLPRWFSFDPAAGRDVLRTLRTRSRKISIGVDDPMFEKIAGYYADILSRDRFVTSFGQAVAQPDLSISAIPIYDHRLPSLRYIFDQLSRDTVAGGAANGSHGDYRGLSGNCGSGGGFDSPGALYRSGRKQPPRRHRRYAPVPADALFHGPTKPSGYSL